MNITILGSGTWGIALARVLFNNGNNVTVWSKFADEASALDRDRKAPNLPGVMIPQGIRFKMPDIISGNSEYSEIFQLFKRIF